MIMATLNISLPDTLKNFAQSQVKIDEYSTPSDYVRSLIRADKKRKETQEKIERMLLESIASIEAGDGITVNSKYWKDKKTRLHAQINKK